MHFSRNFKLTSLLLLAALLLTAPLAQALEKQPAATYQARRQALATRLQGGIAVIFAGEEPQLDFMPYRQDEDFYYLTGWNEPGAALLVAAADADAHRPYTEILFLPTRNLRLEKYTGVKIDSSSPHAQHLTGVNNVDAMTQLPATLTKLIGPERKLLPNLWLPKHSEAGQALLGFLSATLGNSSAPDTHDLTAVVGGMRIYKDEGEIALLKKASLASNKGIDALLKTTKPGVTERTLAGKMFAAWMEAGCTRVAYAPIVGSGPNSVTLHYAENERTIENGDIIVVDAACELGLYAADITRTVPANGHFTPRQREIYDVVLGAHKAAIEAFVAGKSKIGDRDRKDPDSLDTVAYNYINTHGKSLDGKPLGQYWIHSLGHMVGLDVHDPAEYPAILRPGMVFTIEPGVYIPEEKLGVRFECTFLVGEDGKLIDLNADLPHTAEEIEAAMKARD